MPASSLWRHDDRNVIGYYPPEGFQAILEYSMGQKNGLHAFGYNSAAGEPIWMKFGKL